MEVNNNLSKIKLLLQNVFEGKIVISENDTEKLLKFLDDSDENSAGKRILDTPGFSVAVYQSLFILNNTSAEAKVFFVQLVTILFKNELQFNKLQLQGFKESFYKFCVFQNLQNKPPPNLYLAFINLVSVQITHYSGLRSVVDCEVWKKILQPNIHLETREISKAVYNFMSKLIWKLDEYKLELLLIEFLGNVIEPILTSEYLELTVIDQETDDALCDKIFPYLNALDTIVAGANNFAPNNKVTDLLQDYFHLYSKITPIYMITKNQSLLKLLNAFSFRLGFAKLQHLLFYKKIDEFCTKMAIVHRNHLVRALNKRDASIAIDFIVQSTILWSNIEKSQGMHNELPLFFERNGQKNEFSLQIIIHVGVPLFKHTQMHQLARNIDLVDEIESFLLKISKSITDYILASGYTFMSLLEERGADFTRKVAIKTLTELPRLKDHLNESQAGPLFQSLYYLLGIFILCDNAGRLVVSEISMDHDDLRLLSHLLDAMKMLLKDYNISWYENVEIVNVQADLINLLKQRFLTPKHIVQVLDLIDICVNKFLSPNMTLLVENNHKQDSTLNEIGEVIRTYAQHEEWEVRDSAFNLLNSCTEIAFVKYVPLQKIIKENNLINIAVEAGLTDTEFYPQCTALRCLAAATKINSIWQDVLAQNVYIYVQLILILKEHAEGLVRKEAAKVLIGVYLNLKIDKNLKKTLYEVMTSAALDDLHWEVQLAALCFWNKAVHSHLTNRGMLDGKFPSVTFSREKRKIVVLNEEEIKRQLTGVMNDLSDVGCLTVLVECMHEINNIDVIVQAHSIAKELIAILDTYKFDKVNIVRVKSEELLPQWAEDKNEPACSFPTNTSTEEERYKVIDNILSVNQTILITRLYDNFNQRKKDDMDTDVRYYLRRKLVDANKFLETFRNTNFSLLIEGKRQLFLDNAGTLSSLLDEMLNIKTID